MIWAMSDPLKRRPAFLKKSFFINFNTTKKTHLVRFYSFWCWARGGWGKIVQIWGLAGLRFVMF
jgi:hypothetical protein